MSLNSIQILGVNVTVNAREEILEYVRKYLTKSQKSKVKSQEIEKKPLVIVTPNPEQVVLAQSDKKFAQILNRADVALPDGIGISLVAKLLNGKWQMANGKMNVKRIAGVEFMDDLVRMGAKEGIGIGLIGGRGGVAVEALECLKRKHPTLIGWAEEGPEVKLDQLDQFVQLVAKKIRETKIRFVFVGLGAPKQEYFIEALSNQLSAISNTIRKNKAESRKLSAESCFLMSVGGSFDILAGSVPRAPFIMRHMGLEWLWRLIREPWRWRRQMALLKFFWLTFHEYVA